MTPEVQALYDAIMRGDTLPKQAELKPITVQSDEEFLAQWNKYMPEKFATIYDYQLKYPSNRY